MTGKVFTRFAPSLGLLFYTGAQSVLLIVLSLTGGLTAAGEYSIVQAVAAPIFGLFGLSMRPLWVGGRLRAITLHEFSFFRFVTTGLAALLLIALSFADTLQAHWSIVSLVVLLKSQEAAMDPFYASRDKEHQTHIVGVAQIIKALCLIAIMANAYVLKWSAFELCLSLAVAILILYILEFCYFSVKSKLPTISLHSVLKKIYLSRNVLIPSAIAAFVISLYGFIPRYGLEWYVNTEAVGRYALASLPATAALIVVTGYAQSKSALVAAYIVAEQWQPVLSIFRRDVATMVTSNCAASGVIAGFAFLHQVDGELRDIMSLSAKLLILSTPALLAQYLSYAAVAVVRYKQLMIINTLILVGSLMLLESFATSQKEMGVAILAACGGSLQVLAFTSFLMRGTHIRRS